MEVTEAILSRRSIRKYLTESIADSLLEQLLRAGMAAPSGFDERPWHFVVIKERGLLKQLAAELEHCAMLDESAAALLVCGDERLEKLKGLWIQDCSACTENILLAAHGLGLGAVWLAIYPIDEREKPIRRLLGLPEQVIPFALVPLGYPGEKLGPEERYDPSRVHLERW